MTGVFCTVMIKRCSFNRSKFCFGFVLVSHTKKNKNTEFQLTPLNRSLVLTHEAAIHVLEKQSQLVENGLLLRVTLLHLGTFVFRKFFHPIGVILICNFSNNFYELSV